MRIVILSIIVLALIMSCKKDQVEPEPEPQVTFYTITAGQSGAGFSVTTNTNPNSFNVNYDSLNLYGVGYDSIDINLDGSFDLFFELNVINPDSMHLITGVPNPMPSLMVYSYDSFESILLEDAVPIGMGGYNYYEYADTLASGMVISSGDNWKSLITPGLAMWLEAPAGGSQNNGPWGGGYDGYMAVRFNGKYGWVHIDCTNSNDPLIMGYAIEN